MRRTSLLKKEFPVDRYMQTVQSISEKIKLSAILIMPNEHKKCSLHLTGQRHSLYDPARLYIRQSSVNKRPLLPNELAKEKEDNNKSRRAALARFSIERRKTLRAPLFTGAWKSEQTNERQKTWTLCTCVYVSRQSRSVGIHEPGVKTEASANPERERKRGSKVPLGPWREAGGWGEKPGVDCNFRK